jgi:transposase-like protein
MKFSKEEKAMWLEDWIRSGKSAWAYAKENGLIPQTFCGWVRRENPLSQVQAKPFVEVPLQRIVSTQITHEILIEKGDVKIRIPLGLSANEFRTILEGLKVSLW